MAARLEQAGHPVRRAARGTDPSFDWTAPDTWPPEIGVLRHAVEGPWVRWHRVRTGMAVGAFTSLVLALAAGSRGGGAG